MRRPTYRQVRQSAVPMMMLAILIAVLVIPDPQFLGDQAATVLEAIDQGAEQPDATPVPIPAATVLPTAAPTVESTPFPETVVLTPNQLKQYQPNELGRIPILMYHAFTSEKQYLDEWTILPDQFTAQLQWLYDNDFYVMPMVDLINNEIRVPPGKHPVLLTFDDASSHQFRLVENAQGELVPDPKTAVGLLEDFFAKHPDFGHTAVFAVVAQNCFNYDGQESTCEDRLLWLGDHGYEVANHTWWHQELSKASDEQVLAQVGDTKLWLDQRVPKGNLSNILVLPFGSFPADYMTQTLRDGYEWDGQIVKIEGIVTVTGGPSPSPSGNKWSRFSINRFNADPDTFEYWTAKIKSGDLTLYTSDGNPTTITIPEKIPDDIASQFDPDIPPNQDMELIRYNPRNGKKSSTSIPNPPVAWNDRRTAA